MQKINIMLDIDASLNNWYDNYISLYNFHANLVGKSHISEIKHYKLIDNPEIDPEIARKTLQFADKGLDWIPCMRELIIELLQDEKISLEFVSCKKLYLDSTINKLQQLGVHLDQINFVTNKQPLLDKYSLILEDSPHFVNNFSEENKAKCIIVSYPYNEYIKDDVLFHGTPKQVKDFVLECINIIELN